MAGDREAGDRRSETTTALCALAHPLTIASLVVLALNDHVLKQAWPGWVTGKLSDVTGLVVAPAVLAVALALAGVRRPHVRAVLLTGAGFTLVKSTELGADVANALWSTAGWTTYIRHDLTDLIALPALLVPLRVHRLARLPRLPRRVQATAAAGALLLPLAVLATAATSPCRTEPPAVSVGVFEGLWGPAGGQPPAERRAVFDGRIAVWMPDGEKLRFQMLTSSESERIVDEGPALDRVCDPARPARCWRDAGRDAPTIEESTDGGRSWDVAWAMSKQELAAVRDLEGESCGKPVEVPVSDLAALPTDDGLLVLAAIAPQRLVVRDPADGWREYGYPELSELIEPPPRPDPTHQLVPVDPTPGVESSAPPPAGSTPATPATPQPPCDSPSWVTVTPDPRNGQPTVQPQCPPARP